MTTVEILISAMYQEDLSMIDNTNINTDALLINQCNQNNQINEIRSFGNIRCISTTERGLSRSRNMAIENSNGKYCLICDDDEVLYSGYEREIENAYQTYPDADLICFQIKRDGKKYSNKPMKINYMTSLRISSWQISMKIDSVRRAGVMFDVNFGSGTPLGSGEENIFMFDCLKAGLKIYYVPICIGEVAQKESRWFKGFTEEYFRNRGAIIKRMMGKGMGALYCLYFAFSKYKVYKENISWLKALKLLFHGMRMDIS